ncbi:hypothetical protein JW960_23000 [candidate division KSB1 bacterium]|nr:hypothetical protein [candidate division KSB1 bacterium]
MNLEFIKPSDQELIDAFWFYEKQQTGLGDRFLSEFKPTKRVGLKR